MNKCKKKLVSKMILGTIWVLIFAVAFRCYSLKSYYDHSINSKTNISTSIIDEETEFLRSVIENSNDLAQYYNIIDSQHLHQSLKARHSDKEIKDAIFNEIPNPEVHETILESVSYIEKFTKRKLTDMVSIIGTRENVIFTKHNVNAADKDMQINANYIKWEELDLFNSKTDAVSKAFYDVFHKSNAGKPVILSLSDNYKGDNYYSTQDMIEVYKKQGLEGLGDYYFLTVSAITNDGDIFGNQDKTFMKDNLTNKIFYYQLTSVKDLVDNHQVSLDKIKHTGNIMSNEMTHSFMSNMISSVGLNIMLILCIIFLLFTYKETINGEDSCEGISELLDNINSENGEKNNIVNNDKN